MPTRWKPADMPTLTPAMPGGAKLIEFSEKVFGATAQRRYATPDGGVAHAEIRLGESLLMTGDPFGEHVIPPGAAHVFVPDVDVAYRRALDAGAIGKEPPTDQFYGDRVARVIDPFGNQWSIATHVEDVPEDELRRRVDEAMKG